MTWSLLHGDMQQPARAGRELASPSEGLGQSDSLAAVDTTNAVEEGLDAVTDSSTATTRLSNTCQISDKVARVTGSQQSVMKAGRRDELAYQMAKKTEELGRDMESIMLQNQAEVTGSSGTARKLGALECWFTTNASRGATGADGGLGNTQPTGGTARAFAESQLKDVIKQCWNAGGKPDTIMVSGAHKQVLSTFTGNATRQKDAMDRRLVTSIDLYDSDFGDLEVVPNRFQRGQEALILQMDMFAVAFLRNFRWSPLAKTGDSEREQLLVEYTLECRNEAASGIVADLS